MRKSSLPLSVRGAVLPPSFGRKTPTPSGLPQGYCGQEDEGVGQRPAAGAGAGVAVFHDVEPCFVERRSRQDWRLQAKLPTPHLIGAVMLAQAGCDVRVQFRIRAYETQAL